MAVLVSTHFYFNQIVSCQIVALWMDNICLNVVWCKVLYFILRCTVLWIKYYITFEIALSTLSILYVKLHFVWITVRPHVSFLVVHFGKIWDFVLCKISHCLSGCSMDTTMYDCKITKYIFFNKGNSLFKNQENIYC
jgi:hypothetical protein